MNVLFASNNVSDWGNNPSTTVSTTFFDSTRVPYAIVLPDDTLTPMKSNHAPPTGDTVWYHFRLATDGYPGLTEDGKLLDLYDGSGAKIGSLNMLDGDLAAEVYGDTTSTGVYAPVFVSGGIAEVDIMVRVNATEVTVELYAGQALVSTATAGNSSAGLGVSRRLDFALVDAVNTGDTCAFSEFIVADSDTRNARLTRLDPTIAGNYSQWGGAVANLADDDDTTAVTSASAGQRMSALKAAFSGPGTISTVVTVARAAADVGAPQSLTQFLRIGGVDYDGAAKTLTPGMEAYVQNWSVDPSTGQAWTAPGLDAAEIGLLSGV